MSNFITVRHVRLARLYSRRWQRRIIFVFGGLAVGLAAVGLAVLADDAQDAFHFVLDRWSYVGFFITPLGFGLAAYLTRRFFPNAQGSGIPQAIAARTFKEPEERAKLVGLRTAVAKIFLTLLGLLVGASTGREGPTVQIGAAIMFAIGRVSPRRQVGLILAGAAAGVAAAFNTPLAGIVFGIEEMGRSFETRTSGLIVAAVITAGMTSLALFGNYTYFGSTSAMVATRSDWLAVIVCGVIGGFAGGFFSRILIATSKGISGRIGGFMKAQPVWFAVLCGLGVAFCGLLSHGLIYGTGYSQARSVLHDTGSLPWTYTPLKFAATLLSSASGIPGGIFSPSLSIGAGLGADLSHLFPSTPLGALVLLGMVSYLTGVVQAPITGFVIVSELTDNHAMLVPLMAAAVIAHACSRLVCAEGVYHALAKQLLNPK